MTHYDVLGVTHAADRAAILAAYRRWSIELNGRLQRDPDPAERREIEARMRAIEEARRVLADPQRRLAYDLSLIPTPVGAGRGPATDGPQAPTVRSVSWIREPEPAMGVVRRWNWGWVAAIVVVGLLAFFTGLALITGGLRPVMVGPSAPFATPSADVLPPGAISPAGP